MPLYLEIWDYNIHSDLPICFFLHCNIFISLWYQNKKKKKKKEYNRRYLHTTIFYELRHKILNNILVNCYQQYIKKLASSTCKEFGSRHSILKQLKAEQTEKPSLLGPYRKGGTQGKSLPQRDRQIQGVTAYQSRESLGKVTQWTRARETWTVVDGLLKAMCGKLKVRNFTGIYS